MTLRDDLAARLREHSMVQSVFIRGCACGDWTTRSDTSFEQHLADVVLFYFPSLTDRSSEQ